MSAIFLPRKWRHQPLGPLELLPSFGDADVFSPNNPASKIARSTGTEGTAAEFSGIANGYADFGRSSEGLTALTLVAYFDLKSRAATDDRGVFGSWITTATNLGYVQLVHRPQTSTTNKSCFRVLAQASPGEAQRFTSSPDFSATEGLHTLAATIGANLRLYLDGVLVGSSARASAGAFGSVGAFRVGNYYDNTIGRALSANVYYALALRNTELGADAIAQIHDNPWQVFRAPSHRIWFDVGAGAPAEIEGDVIAEESGADTLAATGSVVVAGSLAATETGADTFAATGGAVATGTLAASESGVDAIAFAGKVLVAGSLAATETGADIATATGAVLVAGTVNAAETGADTASATGAVLVAGTLSAAETGADTFSASGAGLVTGTFSAVESGADTLAAAGKVVVSGALSASEAGADTWAATGAVLISGSLSASESGTDTFSSTGEQPRVTGDLATSEIGTDGFAAVGIVPAIGSFDLLEAGHDSLTGVGQIIVAGSLGAAESGEDSFYSTPAGSISGLMAAVEAADSFSARGHGRSAHGVRMSADRGYQSMTMGRPVQRVTTRRPRQRG